MAPPFATTTSPAAPASPTGPAPPFVPSAFPGPPPGAGAPGITAPSNTSLPSLPTVGAGSTPPRTDTTAAATTNWPPAAEKNTANEKITSLLTLARTKLDEGRIAEAHLLLSPLCREPVPRPS